MINTVKEVLRRHVYFAGSPSLPLITFLAKQQGRTYPLQDGVMGSRDGIMGGLFESVAILRSVRRKRKMRDEYKNELAKWRSENEKDHT